MARRKTRSRKDENIIFLEEVLEAQGHAIKEGPKQKTFSLHDLKTIKPKTEAQRQMFESYFMGNHIVATGSPGTGKSYCGLWLALNSILDKEMPQDKIIIVRSIVETGKGIGYLPGDATDKLAPYEAPYIDIVNSFFGKESTYNDLKSLGKLEFVPTSFVRGITWNNAIVIVDEIQNLELFEAISVASRLGENSRIMFLGDGIYQNDLQYSKKVISGFDKLMKILERVPEVDRISFTRDDIVRSGFVKSFICACEDVGV